MFIWRLRASASPHHRRRALKSLRQLGVCAALFGSGTLFGCASSSDSYDSLRNELLAMRQEDQSLRKKDISKLTPEEKSAHYKRVGAIDERLLARLKEIVNEYGWPSRSMVGDDAALGAWLILQHAARDPEYQSRMLPTLQQLASVGDLDPADVAYLTDRVRVNQGKPQLYGTQYQARLTEEGQPMRDDNGLTIWEIPLVEDVENLDARRAAVGLGPWFDYESAMASRSNRKPAARPRSPDDD